MMNVGDRVRVRSNVVVYHHPEHRNEPYNIKGMEGTLASIRVDWNGRPIIANYPFQVEFEEDFKTHLHRDEIEVLVPAKAEREVSLV